LKNSKKKNSKRGTPGSISNEGGGRGGRKHRKQSQGYTKKGFLEK